MSDMNCCDKCGRYIAGSGILQAGPDGRAVLVCDSCDALSENRACPSHRGDAVDAHQDGVLAAVAGYMQDRREGQQRRRRAARTANERIDGQRYHAHAIGDYMRTKKG